MFNAKSKYIFGKHPFFPLEKVRWDLQKTISRRCLLLACVFAASLSLNAQKLLQTWPVGVPLCYVNWFDDGTYTIDTIGKWTPYRQDFSVATIEDIASKKLLFQSNGLKVADATLRIIENGDSLVENEFYKTYSGVGIPITQGVIALPRDANTWWVFVMSFSDSAWKIKNTSNPVPSPDRLYAAIVDINANNGAGKVIAKKIPVHKGVMGDCRLTACRHANGRDWWLVNHGWNDSVYNKWLVTPDSIYGVFRDTAGTLHKEPDLDGMAQFSLDGTKYAMGSGNGLVNIFNFDRCIGNFFNLKTINNEVLSPWSSTSLSPISGLSFSPNGNLLYTSYYVYIYQYNLNNLDTTNFSKKILAVKDSTYKNSSPFFNMALTPHNTIMIANFQGYPPFCNYHEIVNPDSPGVACNFQKESFYVPSSVANNTLPNLANIELGAIIGSPCDTIISAIEYWSAKNSKEQTVRVFPNPANKIIYVELDNNRYFKGELTVADNTGKIIHTNKNYDGAAVINVQHWANGIYFYSITGNDDKHNYFGKFVVQH